MSIGRVTPYDDDNALVHHIWRTVQHGPFNLTADAVCWLLQLVYSVWNGLANLWDLRDVVEDLRLHSVDDNQKVLLQLLCGFSLEREAFPQASFEESLSIPLFQYIRDPTSMNRYRSVHLINTRIVLARAHNLFPDILETLVGSRVVKPRDCTPLIFDSEDQGTKADTDHFEDMGHGDVVPVEVLERETSAPADVSLSDMSPERIPGSDSVVPPIVAELLRLTNDPDVTRPDWTMNVTDFVANADGLDGLQRVFLRSESPHPVYIPSAGNRTNRRALGIRLSDTTVADLLDIHVWGHRRTHTVMNCMEHVDERWSASKASEYFQASMKSGAPPEKPFNLLSNEVSNYPIGNKIGPSFIPVRHDWATRFNDDHRRLPGSLRWFGISDQGSFTHFHPDFSGNSNLVYMVTGRKIFYFIEPTPTNLSDVLVTKNAIPPLPFRRESHRVFAVELKPDDALFIPGGWIHAVHTLEPSTMLTSDFLHDYNILQQLRVWRNERNCPFVTLQPDFVWLNWRAANDLYARIGQETQGHDPLPNYESLLGLAEFIEEEATTIATDSANYLDRGVTISAVQELGRNLRTLVESKRMSLLPHTTP